MRELEPYNVHYLRGPLSVPRHTVGKTVARPRGRQNTGIGSMCIIILFSFLQFESYKHFRYEFITLDHTVLVNKHSQIAISAPLLRCEELPRIKAT